MTKRMGDGEHTYAVVMHTTGTGYVVRTVYRGWLPAPYTNVQREGEYLYEKMAQKVADRWNREKGFTS